MVHKRYLMCQKVARKFPTSNINSSVRDLFSIIFEDIIFDNENIKVDDDDDDDDYSDDDMMMIVATLGAVFK
jgi:hypothetical protein